MNLGTALSSALSWLGPKGTAGISAAACVGGLALYRSQPLRSWVWSKVQSAHKVFTALSYAVPFTFQSLIYRRPTKENARWFRNLVLSCWLPVSAGFHTASWRGMVASTWQGLLVKHFVFFYAWDFAMCICFIASVGVEDILGRRSTNRLFGADKPQFKGKKICVLGNGPSLVKGEPLGKYIDEMDEVVRFNNFQTKASGMEAWTGSKTTVHFSDSMLFPSYPEYHVPGASLVLSLFNDRLLCAGSYFIFRIGIDLAWNECFKMLGDEALGAVSEEDINNLKKELGITHWKHPTSGVLGIDWMVRNRPDTSEPVYIHGFDFFEGDLIHYYNKTEPLYERINNHVGVNTMHQPEKEKAYVARLVEEGKVKWLRDLPAGKK